MNSEFRTDHSTHFTTEAFSVINHFNDVVSIAVGLAGLIEDVLRAELHAEATPFAPFLLYENLVLVGFNGIITQNSPRIQQIFLRVMAI